MSTSSKRHRSGTTTCRHSCPGSARIVHLADGGTVHEQVTRYERPRRFDYRLHDFSDAIIRRLASGARGEWTFTPVPGGTLAIWTYTFTATNAATALPLAGIAQVLWRGYMDICLENTRRLMGKTGTPG